MELRCYYSRTHSIDVSTIHNWPFAHVVALFLHIFSYALFDSTISLLFIGFIIILFNYSFTLVSHTLFMELEYYYSRPRSIEVITIYNWFFYIYYLDVVAHLPLILSDALFGITISYLFIGFIIVPFNYSITYRCIYNS